jgi:hypothetical protein
VREREVHKSERGNLEEINWILFDKYETFFGKVLSKCGKVCMKD